MGTYGPWNWRLLTVPKTTKMMLVRSTKTSLKMTMLFLYIARPHSHPTASLCVKVLTPCLLGVGWKSAFGQMSMSATLPHSCQHLEKSKLSFPPTWSICWLLRGEQPNPTYLSVTCRENGLLLSHKKWNLAICNKMDELEAIILSEISHTEKEKYHMISL